MSKRKRLLTQIATTFFTYFSKIFYILYTVTMYFRKHSNLFEDNYVVLDLETTGLKAERCEIIEIGAIRVRNGRPVSQFSTLVKPKDGIVPSGITAITHITTEMVANAPSIDDVSWWLWDFIGNDPIVGYNIRFDLSFLYLHTNSHFTNTYIDVLPLCQEHFPGMRHRLTDMSALLKTHANTHRATDDCRATMELFELYKKGWPRF